METSTFSKAALSSRTGCPRSVRKYSQEIRTPEFGCGLEGVLRKRAADLTGILNGVDYAKWNPAKDPWLVANYSVDNLEGKRQCKIDLLNQFGILDSRDRPLIGIISRLADQKGFDLLHAAADTLVQDGFSMVVLGTGEEKYSRFFLVTAGKVSKLRGRQDCVR